MPDKTEKEKCENNKPDAKPGKKRSKSKFSGKTLIVSPGGIEMKSAPKRRKIVFEPSSKTKTESDHSKPPSQGNVAVKAASTVDDRNDMQIFLEGSTNQSKVPNDSQPAKRETTYKFTIDLEADGKMIKAEKASPNLEQCEDASLILALESTADHSALPQD